MENIGKVLLIAGLFIAFIGVIFMFIDKLPFSIGKLPGDIYIKRDNFTFYFPLTTSILLSVIISLIFILLARLSR